MPKVNCRCHEPGEMVPELRLPGCDHGDQGCELKAEEEAVQNADSTLPSSFAQETIRREPPEEIQHYQRWDDGGDDRHEDTLVPAVRSFQ